MKIQTRTTRHDAQHRAFPHHPHRQPAAAGLAGGLLADGQFKQCTIQPELCNDAQQQTMLLNRWYDHNEGDVWMARQELDKALADSHTLELSTGGRLRAKHILVGTGSRVSVPAVPGLADAPFWTPAQATMLREQLRRQAADAPRVDTQPARRSIALIASDTNMPKGQRSGKEAKKPKKDQSPSKPISSDAVMTLEFISYARCAVISEVISCTALTFDVSR